MKSDVDHPQAFTCYAWSSPIEVSQICRFCAVLGVLPVDSAQDAVRAAIVSNAKAIKTLKWSWCNAQIEHP